MHISADTSRLSHTISLCRNDFGTAGTSVDDRVASDVSAHTAHTLRTCDCACFDLAVFDSRSGFHFSDNTSDLYSCRGSRTTSSDRGVLDLCTRTSHHTNDDSAAVACSFNFCPSESAVLDGTASHTSYDCADICRTFDCAVVASASVEVDVFDKAAVHTAEQTSVVNGSVDIQIVDYLGVSIKVTGEAMLCGGADRREVGGCQSDASCLEITLPDKVLIVLSIGVG